uniref:Secreted protein n=1 Tax=Panagrellus redivivus TaxID=6233 RepID=A0A7E4VZA9_PANRE
MARLALLVFLGFSALAITNGMDHIETIQAINKDPYRLEHLLKVAARHCQDITNEIGASDKKAFWDECMKAAKVCVATEELCDDLDQHGFIQGGRNSCEDKRLDCYKNIKEQFAEIKAKKEEEEKKKEEEEKAKQ